LGINISLCTHIRAPYFLRFFFCVGVSRFALFHWVLNPLIMRASSLMRAPVAVVAAEHAVLVFFHGVPSMEDILKWNAQCSCLCKHCCNRRRCHMRHGCWAVTRKRDYRATRGTRGAELTRETRCGGTALPVPQATPQTRQVMCDSTSET